MSAPARNKDNEAAIQLTIQANTAELNGDYQLASDLHKQATQLLNKAIATLEEKTEERKRAKLQLRTAQARQTLMQSVAQGKAQAPNPLPTSLIVQKEVTQPGITFLSFVCSSEFTSPLPPLIYACPFTGRIGSPSFPSSKRRRHRSSRLSPIPNTPP